MLLIHNGTIADPCTGTIQKADLFIKDGVIRQIGSGILEKVAGKGERPQVIDATGCFVLPGLVDVHVHFRDPGFTYKEDIESGARAAARGGVTTVVLMANTRPPVDRVETLQYVLEKGAKTGIHVESCATISQGMKGQEAVSMEELQKAGARGFTDDGLPLLEEQLVRSVMQEARRLHTVLSFHEEDPALICNNGINRGRASQHFGIGGSPREAEITLVKRDLKLALETGARVVFQHISTREAVELIRQAKAAGGDIHAEATPHHLTLTEEAAIRYGTLAKMNPPLREEADRRAILEGVKDGTLDLIATDHAPHSREEKERPVTEAPSGIIGLETSLSLCYEALVEKEGMPLLDLLERMAYGPARLYGLDAGYLAQGGPADLCIFDPRQEFCPTSFASRSQNSPFLGQKLQGRVRCTICRGQIIYQDQSEG